MLISLNAAVYLILSYSIMWHDLRAWLGIFTLLLALFYGIISIIMFRRTPQHTTLGYFALGIAIVIFTIAVPIQLRNQAWTTLAWAVELVLIVWFSLALPLPKLRGYGYAVFVLLVGQLLFFKTALAANIYRPLLNERFLVYVIGIAAAYTTGYILSKYKDQYEDWRIPYSTFIVGAHFLTVWVLSFEVWDYFGSLYVIFAERFNAQQLSLTVLWALYAVGLMIFGIVKRSRPVRLAGLGFLVIPVMKLFVYDVFTLKQVYRIVAFICLGILLLTGGFLYQRYSKAIRGFILKK